VAVAAAAVELLQQALLVELAAVVHLTLQALLILVVAEAVRAYQRLLQVTEGLE
jgi:hypothetical protein